MKLIKVTLILLLMYAVQELHGATKAKPKPKAASRAAPKPKPKPTPRAPPKPKPKPVLKCPPSDDSKQGDYQYRVGNGRFYIFHGPKREDFKNWNGAWDFCAKHNMTLAKIDKLTTFFHIANYWSHRVQSTFKDTWYWTAAKYDDTAQAYRWYDSKDKPSKDLVAYSNYFYRLPRPSGVGGHHDKNLVYQKGDNSEQCLAFTFPWPIMDYNGRYGFNPTMDERACVSDKGRRVMCEAHKDCSEPDPGPYELSEGKEDYFNDGNWIFGDRTHIVSWQQRDFNQSEKYCQKLGLEVYNPGKTLQDKCLIPLLKLWSRNVTTSQFWSSWYYKSDPRTVFNAKGTKIHTYKSNKGNNNTLPEPHLSWDHEEITGRSSKIDATFCVALAHHYEFREQLKCPQEFVDGISSDKCHWHFVDGVPANCNNRHGVVCVHKDQAKRKCTWLRRWTEGSNLYEGVKATALVPFGFQTNKQYKRSTYKQTFGSLYCEEGYSMVRKRNEEWWKLIPKAVPKTDIFQYDYGETYWVVDEQKFNKPKSSKTKCTISKVIGGRRKLVKVSCTEWHFYLCKKRLKGPLTPKPTVKFTEPKYKWNDFGPTPRK